LSDSDMVCHLIILLILKMIFLLFLLLSDCLLKFML